MRWQDDPAAADDPACRAPGSRPGRRRTIARFARKFAAVYGREPAPLAVLAYDATALAVLLAQSQPRFTAAQLSDPQGFVGGAGIFRLRPDGLAEHGLAVVEIDAGGRGGRSGTRRVRRQHRSTLKKGI